MQVLRNGRETPGSGQSVLENGRSGGVRYGTNSPEMIEQRW